MFVWCIDRRGRRLRRPQVIREIRSGTLVMSRTFDCRRNRRSLRPMQPANDERRPTAGRGTAWIRVRSIPLRRAIATGLAASVSLDIRHRIRAEAVAIMAGVTTRTRATGFARSPVVAPLAIAAMERIAVPSPWPRLNLCTTVDRLLMFDALPPSLGRPVPGLGRLLNESMEGNDLVQAVAALVAYQLRCLRLDDALDDGERRIIEDKVLACVDSPNEELAAYATSLRDWIGAGR